MDDAELNTKERILSEAKQEFLEKGYLHAALRSIARNAGVTTGALYGCFRSKEALFDALVYEPYRHIISLYRQILSAFFRLTPEEQRLRMKEITRDGMQNMCDYMYNNRDAFKLILCCSEGTKYSHLVRAMAQMDLVATDDFTQSSRQTDAPLTPVNPYLEQMLTIKMFDTFFELIARDIPREQADEYISQLLEFFYAGWTKIMGF